MKKFLFFLFISLSLPMISPAQNTNITAEEAKKKGNEYYDNKIYKEAVKWYRIAADQGNANAQYNLGLMYYNGYGLTKDYVEAVKWYRKAADQGNAKAQHNLGYMYYNGIGVKKDYVEAAKWYRKAAEQGNAKSQHNLGYMYSNGYGVTQDYAEALKWYRKAADQENASSMSSIGYLYDKGNGVSQDYSEALKWYQKAAEQGNAMSMNNIGFLYEKGNGVTQNYQTAKEWYQKALIKDPNLELAKTNLANIEKKIAEQFGSNNNDAQNSTSSTLPKASTKVTIANVDKNNYSNKQQTATNNTEKSATKNNETPRQQTVSTTIMMPDVDKDIPLATVKNPNILAVIIGNEKYSKLPDVPYAENDAKMFKEYCEKTLGVTEKHIRYLPNAGYVDIRGAMNWLKTGTNSLSGDASVIFYYAGHGLPDPNTRAQYILPVDVDGKDLDLTISLQKLYDDMGQMPAKSVTVFLDACFSGTNRDNNMVAANSGARLALTKSKIGTPKGKTVIFSATEDDQTAHPFKDRKHGFFTYFLLRKLQESKGTATLGEIADYVTKSVKRAVFDEIQVSQTPSVKPSGNFANDWRQMKLK